MLKYARILSHFMRKTAATALRRATWRSADVELPIQQMPPMKGIVYETTDGCNSRCLSCNIWAAPTTRDLLSVAQLENILRDPLFDGLEDFIITGGEPSLRADMPEMILAIRRARPKVHISLSTNGLLPDRTFDAVKVAVDAEIPLTVGISLDALGDEHDRVRGVPGNFAKVDALIKRLYALGVAHPGMLRVTVGLTVSPSTVMHMEAVEAYCRENRVNFFPQLYEEFTYYSNTVETLETIKKGGHIEGAAGHYLSEDAAANLAAYPLDPLALIDKLPPSPQNEILIHAMSKNQPVLHPTAGARNFCASLNNFLLLRANGDVAPCLRWSHHRLGNMRDASPSEIWRSEPVRRMRCMVRACSGCSNTWATAWSAEYWFPQFFGVFWRAFVKKVVTRRSIAVSVSAPISADNVKAPKDPVAF